MKDLPLKLTRWEEYTKPQLRWRVAPVTVCVAAIYNDSCVLGAADRMLTATDVQFQPRSSKIWQFTSSIAVMMAGDMGLQAEIYQEMIPTIGDRIKANPNNWLRVSEMAELYSRTYYEFRMRRSEKSILLPFGLNRETFLSRQNELSPQLVSDLSSKIRLFRMPEVGVIITGIDGPPPTPHIYVVENGEIQCSDAVGFAAIGAGYWHANSQFMFAGHTRRSTAAQALLNTFWAKKRAEVAPGVGSETDMFTLGPALGSFILITGEIVDDLESIYKKRYLKGLENHNKRTAEIVEEYVKKLGTKQAPQQPPPPPSPSSP